jgi:hypothetical protein
MPANRRLVLRAVGDVQVNEATGPLNCRGAERVTIPCDGPNARPGSSVHVREVASRPVLVGMSARGLDHEQLPSGANSRHSTGRGAQRHAWWGTRRVHRGCSASDAEASAAPDFESPSEEAEQQAAPTDVLPSKAFTAAPLPAPRNIRNRIASNDGLVPLT